MLSFSSFLHEAQFSEDNFERLLNVIEKRMPKLLGTAIYRCGGPAGVEKVASAVGYLYFFDDRAFRLRAKGGHVVGIDIWNEYHPNKGPAFTADVASLDVSSIIGAMGKIANIIKNPSAGEVEVKLHEDVQLDEMAKRTSPADFYKLMVDKYGEDAASSASNEQIKSVASENDVLIPSFIWRTAEGKGRTAKYNTKPQVADADAPEAKPAGKKEPILYIKITAQDPDSKKFISSADSAAAQKLYAQLSQTVNGAGTAEVEMKDPDTLYGHLSQLVQMACKGSLRALLIYGGPGTGKTFTIMKTVNDMGLVKGKDYVKLSGKASPV